MCRASGRLGSIDNACVLRSRFMGRQVPSASPVHEPALRCFRALGAMRTVAHRSDPAVTHPHSSVRPIAHRALSCPRHAPQPCCVCAEPAEPAPVPYRAPRVPAARGSACTSGTRSDSRCYVFRVPPTGVLPSPPVLHSSSICCLPDWPCKNSTVQSRAGHGPDIPGKEFSSGSWRFTSAAASWGLGRFLAPGSESVSRLVNRDNPHRIMAPSAFLPHYVRCADRPPWTIEQASRTPFNGVCGAAEGTALALGVSQPGDNYLARAQVLRCSGRIAGDGLPAHPGRAWKCPALWVEDEH